MRLYSSWLSVTDKYFVIEFFDSCLRGCAQVMFQNNPLTGFLFFIALFLGTSESNHPELAYGCLLGTVISTIVGYILYHPKNEALRSGLASYNGCLIGAALPLFFANTGYQLWMVITIFSALSVIVTLCVAHIMSAWHATPLTMPFVITTWIALLCCYSFSALSPITQLSPSLPQINSTSPSSFTFVIILKGSLQGISQVFLFSSTIGGIIFLLGLAIESLYSALCAILGAVIAIISAFLLGIQMDTLQAGLYSYSSALTAIAIGCIFNTPSKKSFTYAFFAVLTAVILQGALSPLLSPFGLPVFTLPFILATWLFLIPNRIIFK